jgi:hypothetical protein
VRRERQRQWVILSRKERGKVVVVYEPLRKKEIALRIKRGWELVG